MSKQQFEGRSTAEAAIKACETLGMTRSELKYNIISDEGELMARKVVIEVEAAPPRAPVPAPMPAQNPSRHAAREHHDADSAEDNRGNSVHGADLGGGRPDRGNRTGRARPERRPQSDSDNPGNRAPRAPRSRDTEERQPPRRVEAQAHVAPPSERPRRNDRSERPERPERDNSRRKSGEGRPPRQRDHQDRGQHEGIDSLLTIKAPQADDARHKEITPTSGRSSRALTVVAKMVALLGMQADTVLVSENEAEVHVHLYGADEGRLVGKKGEVLLALQFIVNRILSREEEEGEQVVVLDAGGYRERRQKALEELAKTLAERSVQERKAVRLSPMSAHDRRIFHMVLKDIDTVGTRSEGDGLYRHLLIIPAEFC